MRKMRLPKMSEQDLQNISKSLTLLIWRNTDTVENLHVQNAKMDDNVMKELNKSVHNEIYTLLKYAFSEDPLDRSTVLDMINEYYICNPDWDAAEENKDFKELKEHYKQVPTSLTYSIANENNRGNRDEK